MILKTISITRCRKCNKIRKKRTQGVCGWRVRAFGGGVLATRQHPHQATSRKMQLQTATTNYNKNYNNNVNNNINNDIGDGRRAPPRRRGPCRTSTSTSSHIKKPATTNYNKNYDNNDSSSSNKNYNDISDGRRASKTAGSSLRATLPRASWVNPHDAGRPSRSSRPRSHWLAGGEGLWLGQSQAVMSCFKAARSASPTKSSSTTTPLQSHHSAARPGSLIGPEMLSPFVRSQRDGAYAQKT